MLSYKELRELSYMGASVLHSDAIFPVRQAGISINIKNKRASFDYLLLDKYTAGIVLTGTEIKSIRNGKASLVDTFCYINNGEVWVKNMYVAEYSYGSYNNHSARRDRKLLLSRKEIRNFRAKDCNA